MTANIRIYATCNTKPMEYTEIMHIRISKQQKQTLKKLETFNINISKFIRDAISEKIKRDYKKIKEPIEIKCPF